MPKHKLFEAESSPQLNSSINNSTDREEKRPQRSQRIAKQVKKKGRPNHKIEESQLSQKKRSPLGLQKKTDFVESPGFDNKGFAIKISKILRGKQNMQIQREECVATQSVTSLPDEKPDSDSDSDSMGVEGFFPTTHHKLPYSLKEDEQILKFVLKGQNIFRVGSVLLWKHLEHLKEKPKRTYQSLKNRFLRNIKPNLFTTYKHLITDEETVQRILLKYPELKKQIGRKETLSRIVLPERRNFRKISVDGIFRDRSVQLPLNKSEELEEQVLDAPGVQPESEPSGSGVINELDFHRKVEWRDSSLIVVVNLKYEYPRSHSIGIYETYLQHKAKNKLIPCSACGRCGDSIVEELRDTDVESDSFISNSVQSSKKFQKCSSKKKLSLRNNKSTLNHRRKKYPESCTQRACSPSLLIEVNEIDEFDENAVENMDEKVSQENEKGLEGLSSVVLRQEADSTPKEIYTVSDKDTDSYYQNTVAKFRKIIDSDEEEVLVKKCLKKNRKSIGFDSNLSVDDMHVDSYFVKSNSPDLENGTLSDTVTGSANDNSKASGSLAGTLIQNMLKMAAKEKEGNSKGFTLQNN